MEFRKMVMITLYARQKKRHRCIEWSFGLCGRGQGWDDLGEWHWNMYIIICEMNHQSKFDAWYWVLGAGALGWLRWYGEGGGRGIQDGEHMYTCGGFMSMYGTIYIYIYMLHILYLFIRDGHLVCFHVLTIFNNVALLLLLLSHFSRVRLCATP